MTLPRRDIRASAPRFPTPTPLRTCAQLLLSPHVLPYTVLLHSNRVDVVNVTAYSSIDGRRDHRAPLPTLSLVFFSIWVRFYSGDKYGIATFDLKVVELLLASGNCGMVARPQTN